MSVDDGNTVVFAVAIDDATLNAPIGRQFEASITPEEFPDDTDFQEIARSNLETLGLQVARAWAEARGFDRER